MVDFGLFELPVYSALVMPGIFTGLFTTFWVWRIHSRRMTSADYLSAALFVLIFGWLGARAYHVATHWDYYAVRPDEIAQVGLGGLAMRGGLIAGAMALAFYARVHGWRLARLADAAVVGLCIGQAIGWVGALAQGANYGVVMNNQFALDLPDLYGLDAPRFPLQHAEIILFAGLFVLLLAFAVRRPQAGALVTLYLLVASTANFLLGFQRGDEAAFIGGLRIDQWCDAAFVGLGLVFYWLAEREGKVGINQ